MQLLRSWKESVLFLAPSSFYQPWRTLIGRLYVAWWQKGRWFIITFILASMFLLDAFLLDFPTYIYGVLWGLGIVSWVLSIITLYAALYDVVIDRRLLTWSQWAGLIMISLIVRMLLSIGGAVLDPYDGIFHS